MLGGDAVKLLVVATVLAACSERSEDMLARAAVDLVLAMALLLRELTWSQRFRREQAEKDRYKHQATSMPPNALGAFPVDLVDEKTPRSGRVRR